MRSRRRGHSLIELLAVISVFSVTLSIIALTLLGLQKSGDQLRVGLDAGVQQGRFAHQFRTDAHAAQTCTATSTENLATPATVLQMTLADQRIIEYRLQADGIERLLRSGDTLQHREWYRVLPVLQPGWTVVRSGVRPLVTVALQRPTRQGPVNSHMSPPWRVEAVLNLLSPENPQNPTPAGESLP